MKKTLILLAITWLAFSSCSKEAGPDKRSKFFFFDIKYEGKQKLRYGDYVYNSYTSRTIYEGPKYISSELFDEMVLYVWPEYKGPFFFLILFPPPDPITFWKKGTNITGEYTIRDQVPTSFWFTNLFLEVVPGSEKLTITKTGESNEGKFVEGTMTFNAHVDNDSIPVPATATFRLKKD